MDALRSAMPQHLRTFVEPQVEQLSLAMEPIRCGLYGTLPKSLGEGFLWTAPLGDDCLVSVHSIRLNAPIILEERPTEFSCLFSGSRATLLSMPNAPVSASSERNNLAAFSQPAGTMHCLLQAGVLYESTSVTYTPDYLSRLANAFPCEFGSTDDTMRSFDPASLSVDVRPILRSFTPERAAMPGAAPYFHAKALEAISALAARPGANDRLCIERGARPGSPADMRREDREIAERAKAIIRERFADQLTARSIADELYVSRSKLCEAFRRAHGAGVAECLRNERLQAARQLLATGEEGVADVAHAVGYARTSSFDEAFHREFGCSPTEWRRRARQAHQAHA